MSAPLLIDPATAIVRRHTQDAPVNVAALATELGIPVSYDEDMEPWIAGKIVRDRAGRSPAGYFIYVNARDPHRRQRFTLAHELGHYMLHRDLLGDGLIDDGREALYRSKLGEWYERQANRWAADTLMPAALVRGLFRGGMKSIAELADQLDVSDQAIRIRLNELGLGA